MAKANRGKLGNGRVYQQVRDPHGQHYQVTTPVELHNLVSRGYSLPDGVALAEAAEYLSANVRGRGDVPAATAAASGSGGGAPAGATGGAARSGTSTGASTTGTGTGT